MSFKEMLEAIKYDSKKSPFDELPTDIQETLNKIGWTKKLVDSITQGSNGRSIIMKYGSLEKADFAVLMKSSKFKGVYVIGEGSGPIMTLRFSL